MKIPFSPPYIDEAVINEVVDSLRSGWITSGPKVKALEEEIKSFSGAKEVLCVNSWTSGAIMMLRWLGVKEGDEVIVPAYTYSATALAVLHAGAKPVMVDSGTDFNISVEAVRKAITSKTKAIIPVDIAGFPCDYEKIMALVQESEMIKLFRAESSVQEKLGRILVMNDAAHSLGARYSSRQRTGCETDIAIFSLHAVKNVTTAEGGAICLNLPNPFDNAELYKELRMMSLNCQTKDAFSKSKAGGWRYDIVGFGMKINMADVNAAIGLAQIREYSELLKERKRVFDTYNNAFSACDWAIVPPSVDGEKESSYHIYALRVKGFTEEQRDRMIDEIAKSEVAVNVHFIPMPMLSFFKSMGYDIKDYPQAYQNFKSEISLPIYPQLDSEKLKFIIDTVKAAYTTVIAKTDSIFTNTKQISFLIRFFDIVFSLLGILLLSPVFLLLYIAICLESKGGGFYKQLRVGQYGRDFYVYKFRSMRMGADKKGLITVGGRDPRITRTGYFIRKYKLDELPQLFNVLKGDMSLVGPRPEVRKYVDLYSDEQKKVLSVRPGITDYASIEYVDENTILGGASDPDKAYIEQIMPDKIRYNMKYICNRSVKEYFKIIFQTFWSIIR